MTGRSSRVFRCRDPAPAAAGETGHAELRALVAAVPLLGACGRFLGAGVCVPVPLGPSEGGVVGSVIKKRRKRMAKKKHRKLLKRTRIQRRNKK